MSLEIEAKIQVESLDPVRDALAGVGADDRGVRFERNYVLDNASGDLKRRGVLLRIRDDGGPGGRLTVKTPAEGGEFKTREEVETLADSVANLLRQFLALGYRVDWIYEKIRHCWRWRDCEIALDACPEIGCFVEIEGAPDSIRRAAVELGLDVNGHIADNYLELWAKHLRERGEPRRDMCFTEREKTRLFFSRTPQFENS